MEEKQNNQKVFKISYECCNCGNNFSEDYEKGDKIKDSYFFGVILESHKCTHKFGCDFCRTIKCPVCESEKIIIKERTPYVKLIIKKI